MNKDVECFDVVLTEDMPQSIESLMNFSHNTRYRAWRYGNAYKVRYGASFKNSEPFNETAFNQHFQRA
jgi:hypothetical protein